MPEEHLKSENVASIDSEKVKPLTFHACMRCNNPTGDIQLRIQCNSVCSLTCTPVSTHEQPPNEASQMEFQHSNPLTADCRNIIDRLGSSPEANIAASVSRRDCRRCSAAFIFERACRSTSEKSRVDSG